MNAEGCTHVSSPRHPRASYEALERAACLFRAVGEVSRLRVLELLEDGEVCVTELATSLHCGISTVSQQLKVLRAQRIVSKRRAGKHIYYRLDDPHIVTVVRDVLAHVQEGAVVAVSAPPQAVGM